MRNNDGSVLMIDSYNCEQSEYKLVWDLIEFLTVYKSKLIRAGVEIGMLKFTKYCTQRFALIVLDRVNDFVVSGSYIIEDCKATNSWPKFARIFNNLDLVFYLCRVTDSKAQRSIRMRELVRISAFPSCSSHDKGCVSDPERSWKSFSRKPARDGPSFWKICC